MSTTHVPSPTSRVRLGLARVDITPPVGIYHPVWGAARHHRSTGVHKPLMADVVAIGPADGAAPELVRAQLDLVNLPTDKHAELVSALSQATGVPEARTFIAYSHTHGSGMFSADRLDFPGGELIPAYLEGLTPQLEAAGRQAIADMQEVLITYATGQCDMAANRDYRDEAADLYACGFNPDRLADTTLLAARVTDMNDEPVATFVNYGCHPTTLAWENTLISPDFVGAARETVEDLTGAPFIFMQSASGNLGPRYSYVGDPAIADQNGRWLAYATLATLESMGPPATDFVYQGPVISGATLATWAHEPFTPEQLAAAARFEIRRFVSQLPLKAPPDLDALRQDIEDWTARQKEADQAGETIAARDYGAYAERARRKLNRAQQLPIGATYPFRVSLARMGDAVWVIAGGQPYDLLQAELRRRFPDTPLLISLIANDQAISYILPWERYGKGLYQEEPAVIGPGGLEQLIDDLTARIQELL